MKSCVESSCYYLERVSNICFFDVKQEVEYYNDVQIIFMYKTKIGILIDNVMHESITRK